MVIARNPQEANSLPSTAGLGDASVTKETFTVFTLEEIRDSRKRGFRIKVLAKTALAQR